MSNIIVTILSAVTALITSLLVAYYAYHLKNKGDEILERRRVNMKYLNPLRLHLEENHVRIGEILNRVDTGQGKCDALLVLHSPEDVSTKDAQWFNGTGAYLITTCYITGCLFYQIKRVREEIAYLRLGEKDDTRLLNLIFEVSQAFLQNLGIFYITQPSIGNDLYFPERERLLTYREFCQLLLDPQRRPWFDRLINFYLETGRGEHLTRVNNVCIAIKELSGFLDIAMEGGKSIENRYKSEFSI